MALPLVPVEAHETVQANFNVIAREWEGEPSYRGSGDPNGVVTGGPGAMYVDVSTGKRWVHEAATTTNTSWIVK